MEMALLMPWFVFLFIGAYDWGFYAHALISTESAARVVAQYTSTNTTTATDSTTACTLATAELSVAANVTSNTCSGSSPVRVTATQVTGPDGQNAAQVTVQYTTLQLIPIPLLLKGQATFYRTVQMRIRS